MLKWPGRGKMNKNTNLFEDGHLVPSCFSFQQVNGWAGKCYGTIKCIDYVAAFFSSAILTTNSNLPGARKLVVSKIFLTSE